MNADTIQYAGAWFNPQPAPEFHPEAGPWYKSMVWFVVPFAPVARALATGVDESDTWGRKERWCQVAVNRACRTCDGMWLSDLDVDGPLRYGALDLLRRIP